MGIGQLRRVARQCKADRKGPMSLPALLFRDLDGTLRVMGDEMDCWRNYDFIDLAHLKDVERIHIFMTVLKLFVFCADDREKKGKDHIKSINAKPIFLSPCQLYLNSITEQRHQWQKLFETIKRGRGKKWHSLPKALASAIIDISCIPNDGC